MKKSQSLSIRPIDTPNLLLNDNQSDNIIILGCKRWSRFGGVIMTDEEQKEWLFKENMRLADERAKLEEERRAFEKYKSEETMKLDHRRAIDSIESRRVEMEKNLLEKKIALLEKEYIRLANDKEAFELLKKRHRTVVNHNVTYNFNGVDVMFAGVDSEFALKKRYRDLLKIFHPDNLDGDTAVIQDINTAYNNLKKKYS